MYTHKVKKAKAKTTAIAFTFPGHQTTSYGWVDCCSILLKKTHHGAVNLKPYISVLVYAWL